jgi:hypothetical protein
MTPLTAQERMAISAWLAKRTPQRCAAWRPGDPVPQAVQREALHCFDGEDKQCPQCGEEFTGGPRQDYCTQRCQRRAARARSAARGNGR